MSNNEPRLNKASQDRRAGVFLDQPVPPEDPALKAVFPAYAKQYQQDLRQEETDLAPAHFVESADFAVLNANGELETYGKGEKELAATVDSLKRNNNIALDIQEPEDDFQQLLSSVGGGPTTLMLFNIFTPDEVDFLSELVGEDVVRDLKEGQDEQDEEDDLEVGTETHHVQDTKSTENSLVKPLPTLQSRRPPQFSVPKNAKPSSQDQDSDRDHQVSNTRESLETYHKPIFNSSTASLELEEEGISTVLPNFSTFVTTTTPVSVTNTRFDNNVRGSVTEKVVERRQKIEGLLSRLSEKYTKRKQELEAVPKDTVVDVEEHEKNDRLKVMIENLKAKLANSKTGMQRLSLNDLYDRQYTTTERYKPSSAKPIHLAEVESLLGEKIRGLQTGIHRINLDEVLDLDILTVQPDDQQPSPPTPPPGTEVPKNLPKRQVLHPKLIRQRPNPSIIHRPSIQLKTHIEPVEDEIDPDDVKYKAMPIIPRYSDTPFFEGKLHASPSERHYPNKENLSSRIDPYPETRELPPYHNPTTMHYLIPTTPKPRYMNARVSPKYPTHIIENKYKSKSSDPSYQKNQSFKSSAGEEKYVHSNSYRNKYNTKVDGRQAKEYPPPSKDYKRPSLHFGEHPQTLKNIQVTPKNIPVTYHTSTYNPVSVHELDIKSLSSTPYPTTLPPAKDYTTTVNNLHSKNKYTATANVYKSSSLPPEHRVGLSKAHFQSCPKIETKPHAICKNFTQHTCWSEGVRDLDCPLSGLCCFDGCVNTCLPQNYVHSPKQLSHKKPKQLYLEEFLNSQAKHPSIPASNHCPVMKEQNKDCTMYPSHQCWSPGVPDLDCPGSGLCCFNGCVNVCINGYHHVHNNNQYHLHHHHHHHHHHPVSYHTPPNTKYLVPGSVYIPYEAIHGNDKHTSDSYQKDIKDLLHIKYGDGSHPEPASYNKKTEVIKSALKSEYISPKNPEEHAVHNKYLPPLKEYLPPEEKRSSLSYAVPALTSYRPPSMGYLPPVDDSKDHKELGSYSPPVREYLPPKKPHNDEIKVKVPSSHYLPPRGEHEIKHLGKKLQPFVQTKYLPPSKEYVDPESDQYSQGKTRPSSEYLPPDQTYLPPSKTPEHGKGSKNILSKYLPPSKNYLPPPDGLDPSQRYKPPVEEYLPPHESNKALPTKYLPPGKEYLPPKINSKQKESLSSNYSPPSKGYLPPKETNADQGYIPPSKEYLPPPARQMSVPSKYVPPSRDYLPPKSSHPSSITNIGLLEFLSTSLPDEYIPPSKEYLPPSLSKDAHSKYTPPSKEYLPPSSDEHDIHSKYTLPFKEYLPPSKMSLPSRYIPPSKEYLPPLNPHSSKKDVTPSSKYFPPSKDYLPPSSDKESVPSKYMPPSQEYLPPANKAKAEVPSKYLPPSKEYLAPSHLQIDSNYLPPGKDSPIGNTYSPPSKSYLPPSKIKAPVTSKYMPPSHEYLPPKKPLDYVPPSIASSYQPPANDYLPPKEEIDHHLSEYLPPSKDYLTPHGLTDKKLPSSYLPPSKDYLQPKKVKAHAPMNPYASYEPPSREYLPPKHGVEKTREKDFDATYSPPSREYLPPIKNKEGGPKYGVEKYTPPSKEYLPPHGKGKLANANVHQDLSGYLPPSKEYLPPMKHGKSIENIPKGSIGYLPPSKEYLPPAKGTPLPLLKKQSYSPPSKSYLPPPLQEKKLGHPHTLQPGTGYSPPSKSYLPPSIGIHEDKKHNDNSYSPPSKEYLPPLSHSSIAHKVKEIGQDYNPPSKDYLPPNKKDLLQSYIPPSKQYLPPIDKTAVPTAHDVSYNPPHKEYLPPVNENDDKGKKSSLIAKYEPPSKEYLPPPLKKETYRDDKELTFSTPSVKYSLPSIGYLPPQSDAYQPPSKEYLPPKQGHASPYHKDPEVDLKYSPPSKEYLPPKSKKKPSVSYLPPEKSYESPKQKDEHSSYSPPSKEYLPPVKQHKTKVENSYSPPSKDYLPPLIDHNKLPLKDIETYKPPSKSYLPPPEVSHHNVKDHYSHPTKEHKESKLKQKSKGYQVFKSDDSSLSTPSVYVNGIAHLHTEKLHEVYPHTLAPHSINIQINLPNKLYKDDRDIAKSESKYLPPVLPHYIPPPGHFESDHHKSDQGHDRMGKADIYRDSFPLPDDYISPPKESYIPPKANDKPSEQYKPPSKVYLPPLPSIHEVNIKEEPLPEYHPDPSIDAAKHLKEIELHHELALDADYLPPPIKSGKEKYTNYLPPPPRPAVTPTETKPAYVPPTEPEYLPPKVETKPDYLPPLIMNSQVRPPTEAKDHYIPPKTKFDVPKNFITPEEAAILKQAQPPPVLEPEVELINATPFPGIAKLQDEAENKPKLPPMPTMPPQPERFLPLLRELSPELLNSLQNGLGMQQQQNPGFIPGTPGKDYPDFKAIPLTSFSCENFLLEGFYADTFTSCQVRLLL